MTNITLNTATRKCTADKYFLGYEGENNINKLIFKFEDGFRDGLAFLHRSWKQPRRNRRIPAR